MKILFSLLFSCISVLLFSQTLQVYSIKATRQSNGSPYTLDGSNMPGARLKLLNPANFGPAGTYHKTVNITDAFGSSGSLSDVSGLPTDAVFFFGNFDLQNIADTGAFTGDEIDALYNWSLKGGKVIISSGVIDQNGAYDTRVLNDKWGFFIEQGLTHCYATSNSTGLFYNGAFGTITSVNAQALVNDYFISVASSNKILGTSSTLPDEASPSVYMDCKTLDVLVSDPDVFTTDGGVTNSKNVISVPDKFWVNLIAFMDKLQGPPPINNHGDSLSTGSGYVNYQWYHNNTPITGANSPTYNVSDFGEYYVATTLNGGCIVNSPVYNKIDTTAISDNECDLFVPTAFSPDGNGINDKFCAYGKCFKNIEFRVFDRWGEQMFESTSRYSCWDGTYKGEKMGSGEYVWSFKATRPSGTTVNRKGVTTLIRR